MAGFYKKFKQDLSNSASPDNHAWPEASGKVYKMMFVTASYTYSENHQFVSDITNEVVGTGYVRKTLASKTLIAIGSAPTLYGWDCADITWTAANGWTAAGAVVFLDKGGADSANPIVCFIDGGTSPNNFPKTANGSDIVFQVSTSGLFTL